MSLDPEFVRKIQEKKAKREALEKKYAHAPARSTKSGGSSPKKSGPIFRSVSRLDGHEVIISGEDAKNRVRKAEYKG